LHVIVSCFTTAQHHHCWQSIADVVNMLFAA
jgi:hypothetical protein